MMWVDRVGVPIHGHPLSLVPLSEKRRETRSASGRHHCERAAQPPRHSTKAPPAREYTRAMADGPDMVDMGVDLDRELTRIIECPYPPSLSVSTFVYSTEYMTRHICPECIPPSLMR